MNNVSNVVRYLMLYGLVCLYVLPLIICTDPIDVCVKCTWVGWQSWGSCHYEGAKRRVRLMCCPDDIAYPPTLEECFTRCYNDSNGQMKLDDLYDYTTCNGTTSTYDNHLESRNSYSNLFKNSNLPLVAGLIGGALFLLASNILLLGCLCKQKKKKERAFPARRPVPWT